MVRLVRLKHGYYGEVQCTMCAPCLELCVPRTSLPCRRCHTHRMSMLVPHDALSGYPPPGRIPHPRGHSALGSLGATDYSLQSGRRAIQPNPLHITFTHSLSIMVLR